MGYFTKYGGLNMHPHIKGENHPLFRAYYDFWYYLVNGKMQDTALTLNFLKLTNFKEGWYQANIPEEGKHFSRDNMWGIYIIYKLLKISTRNLPVLKWNNKIWWHPNGWMVFLSLKYDFLSFIFYPFIKIMYKYSMNKFKNDPGYSTGPCLWTPMSYFLWNQLPTEDHRSAFKIYCTHGGLWDLPDQPIINLIKKYESL